MVSWISIRRWQPRVSDRGTGQAVGVVSRCRPCSRPALDRGSWHETAILHECARRIRHGVGAVLPEIETWPNQYREPYEIEIVMPEFTAVCPKTGLPDFGKIVVAVCAAAALPGTEIVQDVPVGISRAGDLPGERGEPGAARTWCDFAQPRVGDGDWRFFAPRRLGHGSNGGVESKTWKALS